MSVALLNPVDLFSMYMQVVGLPQLKSEPSEDPRLRGKSLGIVNGSSSHSSRPAKSHNDCPSSAPVMRTGAARRPEEGIPLISEEGSNEATGT